MENVAEKILSPRFIQEELIESIHEILKLKYSVPLLRALNDAPNGRGYRWLDVKVVGVDGSGATARPTLNKLIEAGWVKQEPRKPYFITDRGREALAYYDQMEGLLSSGNDGEGG
ncbi:MAG: hypothetical protein LN416_01415 [Candidatus Thermoplasmatota archaeon]|nr:hypothetical protein [Candidatus Thermoplasmatota archaeon]